MTKRTWVVFFILLTSVQLGALFIGEWVSLLAIVVMAVAGITLTLRHERLKQRISEFLAERPANEQDAILVWDEGWHERPEIVARLGRRGPRVPLRGEREEFTYASHHAKMARLSMAAGVVMIGVVLTIAVVDMPTERSERILLPILLAFLCGITLLMPWQIRVATSRVVVTDDAIIVVDRRGTETATPWHHIVDAKDSSLNQMLMLRTRDGRRVWVAHSIESYGRLANLIETRLPDGVAWRAM